MNIGQLDQMLEAIKDIAKLQSKYFIEMKNLGHSEQEAFKLTKIFMDSLLGVGRGKE